MVYISNYSIVDEFGYNEDYSYLDDLINLALNHLKVDGVFTITFIDDELMHEINLKYRGIDRTTDVISFAFNDQEDNFVSEINVLGDIFVSIPKMKAQALEYGHSEKRELSFLVIHGLLHLLGYDHMNPKDEKVMFGLQEEVLSLARIEK